jgi:hypothetical protein
MLYSVPPLGVEPIATAPPLLQGCQDTSSDTLTVFFYSVGAIGIVFGVMEVRSD